MTTKIEWTRGDDGTAGETWNPLVGCEHAGGPGCDRCYAARDAAGRLAHLPTYAGLAVRKPGEPAIFTGEIRLLRERLDQPLRWTRPRRVFVNSMSDLFHPDVPATFVADVFAVMALARQHTFQVLTKRPQRMAALLGSKVFRAAVDDGMTGEVGRFSHTETEDVGWPLPNVWLGTSIETDRYTWRSNHLRDTPAAVRFISAEPLLGLLSAVAMPEIAWIIAGCESGPGARQTDLAWVRDLRDQCETSGTAFFVKQLSSGGSRPIHDLDLFPPDLRIREYPPERKPTITQPSLL